jgi:hypothetical protein
MLIAIDPGVSGGIAHEIGGQVYVQPMPETLHDITNALALICSPRATVFLEELPKFAGKMSASSMGTMFKNYGRVEGALAVFKTRIEYLPPKKWQAALGLGDKKAHGDRWKAHLKARAQALFPTLKVTLKTSDALLILEAGKKLSR